MTLLIFLMRTRPCDYSVGIVRRLRCIVSAWIQRLEVIINIKQFGKTHRAMMNCCANVKLEMLMTPMPWQLRGGVEIMKDRLHDTRGTKSRDYLETIGDKNFGELKGIRQIRQTFLPPKFFTVRYYNKNYSALLEKYL